ncbi:hypothetical protein J2809_002162 [Arthrobacter pascens]|uniref:hypothetical protein n=1 Tax=Arthrobacter pascens TaxID=1677 RepID=UPI00285D9BF0|nr:hypothetical protein [Arthrobacter pascens]MDR6557802.1 hypothetical protein [Arthrobacter pascens]
MKSNTPYSPWVMFAFGCILGAVATFAVRFIVSPEARGVTLQFITLVVAASAFVLAYRTYKFNELKSKTDLFTSFHEKLIEAEAQKGRSFLRLLKAPKAVKDLTSEQFSCLNRALSLYETLAMYMAKGNIREEDVLETWGAAIYGRHEEIRWFMDYRDETHEYVSWPHLRTLLDRLVTHPPVSVQASQASE